VADHDALQSLRSKLAELLMTHNIQTEIRDGKLVITVDVSENAIAEAPASKTGKSRIVASTGGFVELGNGLSIGLNVITKQPRK
jgi:hypothetical protein